MNFKQYSDLQKTLEGRHIHCCTSKAGFTLVKVATRLLEAAPAFHLICPAAGLITLEENWIQVLSLRGAVQFALLFSALHCFMLGFWRYFHFLWLPPIWPLAFSLLFGLSVFFWVYLRRVVRMVLLQPWVSLILRCASLFGGSDSRESSDLLNRQLTSPVPTRQRSNDSFGSFLPTDHWCPTANLHTCSYPL